MRSTSTVQRLLGVGVLGALAAATPTARAGLTIIPTFDSSITSNANAAAIEQGINAAITQIDSRILNPVTVKITFVADESVGLGQSSTFINSVPYATYRNDLLTKQTLSANDVTATGTLPATTNAPVNSAASIQTALPLLRALGEAAGNNGGTDSTISFKTSLMNLIRTGSQNSSKYDLEQVALHEITEVLGAGGGGSTLGESGSIAGTLDLFRYSAAGVRSFSTSAASAYFSINGGTTNLSNFNQNGSGDYADWGNNAAPQVQDAFSTPGIALDLSNNELTALDIVGWNVSVPEPASLGVLSVVGTMALRRRPARAGV